MRLEGGAGEYLELHIVGYQFQNPAGEADGFDWDANWLVVEGQASDGELAWHFREPCLLTVEARDLADWLDAVADGTPSIEAMDFMEPNLEFRLEPSPSECPAVRITFRLEARPPWAPEASEQRGDGGWLEFELSAAALRAAANDLRNELARYPER